MIKDIVLQLLKEKCNKQGKYSRYDNLKAMIDAQEQKGISKYGGTLDDKNVEAFELFNHAKEELVDLLFYLCDLKGKVYQFTEDKEPKEMLDMFIDNSSDILVNLAMLEMVAHATKMAEEDKLNEEADDF